MRYGIAIAWSAFLLFLVQPLISKAILPWFGGSPALWTTCLLFFQVALLAGYAYAHFLFRRFAPRTQVGVHLGLLLLALLLLAARNLGGEGGLFQLLSIQPDPAWKGFRGDDPTLYILGLLTLSVGLPFFLLSATAPLIQGWYSHAHGGALPYRLYALSNLGSFLSLFVYPLLLQPQLTIPQQSAAWAWGFAAFVGLCAWVGRGTRDVSPPAEEAAAPAEEAAPAPRLTAWALWLLLPACSSALLLAVTNQVCQDVAVVPFLWLLPLGLYLLSFVIAFDRERWYHRGWSIPALVLAMGAMTWVLSRQLEAGGVWVQIAAHCAGLLVGCLVCHGELVRLKPHPRHLTGFYLGIAAGGATGGAFVSLAAPRIFLTYLELPVAMVACCLLTLGALAVDRQRLLARHGLRRVRIYLLVAALGLLCLVVGLVDQEQERRAQMAPAERNFYGVIRLRDTQLPGTGIPVRYMSHGSVLHGVQLRTPELRRRPLAYFNPESGVARAFQAAGRRRERLNIGVVGLGVGVLACYARPSDTLRYYEIDPAVDRLARSEFSFLADCPAAWEVVVGDARISLEREEPNAYDLLILDAFSSDAIPVHLLTRESFQLYLEHLAPEGTIVVQLTNKGLDLRPLVEATAEAFGLATAFIESPWDPSKLHYAARWMILTRDPTLLDAPRIRDAAAPPLAPAARDVRLWTDAYTNLLPYLRTG